MMRPARAGAFATALSLLPCAFAHAQSSATGSRPTTDPTDGAVVAAAARLKHLIAVSRG